MTDRPIIFSAPMILALLAGRKTQTRRIIKPQPSAPLKAGDRVSIGMGSLIGDVRWPLGPGRSIVSNKPGPHPRWVEQHVRYAIGDRLYVRENFFKTANGVVYAADAGDIFAGARPKMTPCLHMPRAISRMTLIVTDVKVERLQDISEADAIAEGLKPETCAGQRMWDPGPPHGHFGDPRAAFRMIWEDINGAESWAANPWVAAPSFEVIERNIDDLPVAV